jgi:hypothetical protein
VPSPALPEPSPFIHPLDDTIPPFSADDCALGNVRIGETKPEELADALGVDPQDVKIEIVYSEPDDPDSAILETSYICGNVRFRVFPKMDGYEEVIDSISVTGDVPWQTPRDIKVGDSYESNTPGYGNKRTFRFSSNAIFMAPPEGSSCFTMPIPKILCVTFSPTIIYRIVVDEYSTLMPLSLVRLSFALFPLPSSTLIFSSLNSPKKSKTVVSANSDHFKRFALSGVASSSTVAGTLIFLLMGSSCM